MGRLADGLAVFVPRTAPGDTAQVEVVQRKSRYARARLVTLSSAGPDRVEPPCAHYRDDQCGGCQLQHLSGESQLAVKRKLVGDAVRRIAKREIADPPIVPSAAAWRYRAKITLAVERGRIGLRPHDRPGATFDLDDCPLVRQRVMQLWALIRGHRPLLPAGLVSLVLREDRAGRLHVVAVGGDVAWDAGPLAQVVDDPAVSFWWKPRGGAARVVWGPSTGFPAVAFEQVNADLAQAIRARAVDSLGDVSGKVVWDLYGGVGDTAELLAGRGATAWSVDCDRSAVEWGRAAMTGRSYGTGSLTRITGRVEELLNRLPQPWAVVVNPTRTGLHRLVTAYLERWGGGRRGSRLCYISCDPATLARDLGRMPSHQIESLTAYDLFPQTGHVETLAVLESA